MPTKEQLTEQLNDAYLSRDHYANQRDEYIKRYKESELQLTKTSDRLNKALIEIEHDRQRLHKCRYSVDAAIATFFPESTGRYPDGSYSTPMFKITSEDSQLPTEALHFLNHLKSTLEGY